MTGQVCAPYHAMAAWPAVGWSGVAVGLVVLAVQHRRTARERAAWARLRAAVDQINAAVDRAAQPW